MTVYSEIDSFACAWLRNLIAAGHIAPLAATFIRGVMPYVASI